MISLFALKILASSAIPTTLPKNTVESLAKNVTNVLLFLVGIAAVIGIVYGGFMYVISGGDEGRIAGAKNAIIYSVVGLIVALLAYAIVNFVSCTVFKVC